MNYGFLERYESLKGLFKEEVLDFLDSIEDPDVRDSDFLIADPQEQFIKNLQFIKDLIEPDDF